MDIQKQYLRVINKISKMFVKKLYFHFSTNNMKHIENVKIIEINSTNIHSYKIIDNIYSSSIIRKRFSEGYKLYTIIENNNAVCFAWSQKNTKHYISEIKKHLKFDNEIYFIKHCITLKKNRNKGFYCSLIGHITNLNSPTSSFIGAYSDNIASNKGIAKAGFIKKLEITKFLFIYFNKNQFKINFELI